MSYTIRQRALMWLAKHGIAEDESKAPLVQMSEEITRMTLEGELSREDHCIARKMLDDLIREAGLRHQFTRDLAKFNYDCDRAGALPESTRIH